jgi:hypothetical protein
MIVAMPLHAGAAEELPAYCPALRDIAALVHANDKFASIIGRPREGNYFEATLSLPGWADCSFYGTRTYVCDSRPLPGADAVALALARTVSDVKSCLGDHGWAEDAGLASPGYAVIRNGRQASITINADKTDKDEHVVRFILFLRSR